MKILIFVFSLLSLNAVNTYILERVNGIVGDVNQLEFDSDGNAYVFTFDGQNQRLYKLNSTNDLLWTIDTADYSVRGIIINSQKKVYLKLYSRISQLTSIGILREDTLTIEEIVQIMSEITEPILLDEEDNLYYNGLDGIALLRPNSTVPILIQSLENTYCYYGDEGIVIDSAGNIYIGVVNIITNNISIAMVTKEAKHEEIPSATLFDLSSDIYVEHLLIDDADNLWVFVWDSQTSYIKRISNNIIEDRFSDDVYRVLQAKVVKNRVYFFPAYVNHNRNTAFFFTSDVGVQKIPELENVVHNLFTYSSAVVDNDDNLYFGIYFPNGNNQILIIRPPDQNNTWISFSRAIRVRFIALDENDDLWIIGDGEGVYVLRKGEETPIEVIVPPEVQIYRGINVNKKSKQVFILNSGGLFVGKNDS